MLENEFYSFVKLINEIQMYLICNMPRSDNRWIYFKSQENVSEFIYSLNPTNVRNLFDEGELIFHFNGK